MGLTYATFMTSVYHPIVYGFDLCYLYDQCLSPHTVNREILFMVLFWPILAPKYEVPKLNTPKYVTLQKLTAKI